MRCIEDCNVQLGAYVALVGANGVGKSTILEAVRFVLDPTFRPAPADVNICSPDKPLEVTLRCGSLSAREREEWSDFARPDGAIEIRKTATPNESGTFHVAFPGEVLQHAGFRPLREAAAGDKNLFKAAYKTFRELHPDYGLSNHTRADDIVNDLLVWERAHPERCERSEVEYDMKKVQRLLAESFRVVHVPAVSPVEDTVDGRRSALSGLIDQMLGVTLQEKPELIALQEQTRARFREIFPADAAPELHGPQALINESLAQFAPNTSMALGWDTDVLPTIAPPPYRTVVIEDGVPNAVQLKGNGVQRALVVSVLNALNIQNNARHGVEGDIHLGPTTILLVEEPELYQHPTRARLFANALNGLANINDGGPRMQVILTTHSPYFVSVANFAAVRLVRRQRSDGRATPARRVSQATLNEVWAALSAARGHAITSPDADIARMRLESGISLSVREGFFADAIVLVEGASDVAALAAGLARRGAEPDALGIAILFDGGVGALDRLWVIFSRLEIPLLMLFDGDRSAAANTGVRNSLLLSLVGAPISDHPPTTIGANYAVFDEDRETTLRAEFGPDYDTIMDETCRRYGYDRRQGEKVVGIVREVYEELHQRGRSAPTLDALCDAIVRLVP